MKEFWPMARCLDGQILYTYEACLSVEECLEVFKVWEKSYNYILDEMWINVEEGDKKTSLKVVREFRVLENSGGDNVEK